MKVFQSLSMGVGVVLGFAGSVSAAQDRRTVVEPSIPPACVTLEASLTLHEGKLGAADEVRLDTSWLQQALAGCAPGKAVELRSGGGNDAFLTGPLRIPRGEPC